MKFAKVLFWCAGIWGILVLTPMFFLFDLVGRQNPPAVTHPEFFYGFLCITMVYQFLFFIIASDPARFRPVIFVSILEKFGFFVACVVLHMQGRINTNQLVVTTPDLVLGTLFICAFYATRSGGRN